MSADPSRNSAPGGSLEGAHQELHQTLSALVARLRKADEATLTAVKETLTTLCSGPAGSRARDELENLAKELKELWAKLGGGMASEAEALPGGMVKAVVTGILPTFVAVRLGPRVGGRIAITDVVNADAMPLLKSSPLADLKKGQVR